MTSVKKMSEKYYPEFWSIERLKTLVAAGKLTEEEFYEVTGEKYTA